MKLSNIQIKKILYATDLSESAVHAFSYAVSLANMYGAGITILHVLAEFPGEEFIANMISTDTWKEIKNRHYSEARDQLIGKKRNHVAIKEVLEAFSEKAKADAEDQSKTEHPPKL
jgi:nucleotide-binding universal stress UspA family protein